MAKDLDDVIKEFIWYKNMNANSFLKSAREMTPIEGIVLLTLEGLIIQLGQESLNVRPQMKIGKYTVDFLIEYNPIENPDKQIKIVVECDGHDFHEKTKKQVMKDKIRDRYFVKKGYLVFRYSGSEIVNDRFKVYKDLLQMLLPTRMLYDFGLDEEA